MTRWWSETTARTPPPAALPPVEVGRINAYTPAAFNKSALVNGLRGRAALPNPAGSLGCSPLLRELFAQGGVTAAVSGELYADGQVVGHASGDALDLADPADSPGALDAALRIVQGMPSLFSLAAYYRPDTPQASVFVWDGSLISFSDLTDSQTAFLEKCSDHLHVSSSRRRLLNALQVDPTVTTYITTVNVSTGVLVREMFAGPALKVGSASIESNPRTASA